MARAFIVIQNYVVPFLMGVGLAATAYAGDTAWFSVALAAGCFWLFSSSVRVTL
jgi:hypothetical protein